MDQQPPARSLSALLLQLYDIPPAKVKDTRQFQGLRNPDLDKALLLSSIPATPRPSHRPLHLLHAVLSEIPGPWPTFALVRCQSQLSKLLPEGAKSDPDGEPAKVMEATADLVKASYRALSDFMGRDDRPALRTTSLDNHITHRGLHDFVTNFELPVSSNGRKPVVAIALPNGPLLAATCMAAMSRYTAAPINPAAGAEQFRADVLQAEASFILTTPEDFDRLQLNESWVGASGIDVGLMEWSQGDSIAVRKPNGHPMAPDRTGCEPNKADDIALILFTSGTSGTKKVVPLTTHSIVAGVVFVMDSWGLSSTDICLNMMPLYHVGGLVRNIFAPIFSGGSTVCCSAFDPNLFWDVVQEIQPTWYYASPSMHSVILSEAAERPQALQKSRIRLACNAAGGLLPSLACQLRDTFHCVVLPSYGMTECMPISTPPLDYRLDREGTSGVSTGPELTVLDWSEKVAPSGAVGRICVRGEPVFPGYLKPDGTLDKSPFNASGWFDTGDLGYMDDDGYLYITGRSKEVINRGGELISPFEVENAIMAAAMSVDSPIGGRVSQALAFSACHDVLQEVVAVALVTPPNSPRVDLKTLHGALRSSLQQVKWPVLITYMNDLPKKNNKVLRIKLGQRLGLPDVTDDTAFLLRHWEAACPAPDTALSVGIESAPCSLNYDAVSTCLDTVTPADYRHHCRENPLDGNIEAFLAPAKVGVPALDKAFVAELRQQLASSLHNYMVPDQIHLMRAPFERDGRGKIDEAVLQSALDELAEESLEKLAANTQGQVTKAFADVLSRPAGDIPSDVDFFELGGDSLRAGRLVSILRSRFNVHLPISLVFSQGTVAAIAAHLDKVAHTSLGEGEDSGGDVVGCTTTRSSTNPLLMLAQLIPLAVFYPLRRALQWTVFIVALSYTQKLPTHDSVIGRLVNLTLCILFARIVMRCFTPFVGILAKWLIIGRYREGLYPMWGWYHTRWWMAEKVVSLCGMGLFGLSETTQQTYYRLMGAKIGKNVKLTGVSMGEWDLVDIRDGAVLTRCVCRPFAAEGNTSMYLGRIVVGENSSVGLSSILVAGSSVPPNTCIGPNSSSWELEDADEANREVSLGGAKPHWLLTCLFTMPLGVVAWFLSLLPWAGGLVGMVMDQPSNTSSPLRAILNWFTEAERVGYHYLALILRCFFSPFILFAFAVLVKVVLDAFFGKLDATSTTGVPPRRTAVTTWRAALIKTLLPVPKLHSVTGLFGQHYEATSVALRMLGGKIGKRVYWPGTGPSIGDYHLLDVGNDVVFGSRAHLVTTDGTGSERVTIGDRAMIADRVCVLPGVEIGERATMGSGALTRRGQTYPANSTFVGSKGGDAVCLSTGRDAVQEKPSRRERMQHMSSDDTLTADGHIGKKQRVRTQIQHMSSDDTLAEAREPSKKQPYQVTADPFMTSDSDTDDGGSDRSPSAAQDLSPFGRAFYLKLAPYRVMGPFAIFCYSSFLTVFTAFYWNVPNISAIQLVNFIIERFLPQDMRVWVEVVVLYGMMSLAIAILTTIQAVLALAVVVGAKWALLGRRLPGNYDWDKSPYCQRWQLFLCIEKLRRQCYRGQGILGLLTGTSWIALYFRALGAQMGKDCALFANGRPSLMFTEPDLISLGDRVVVDDASVVAHINTRGKFDLNRLGIGNRCVLRSGSRLLSGATMEDDSCLLEHTLIMGGDVVEARRTMQGWPAERFSGQRVNM